MAAKRPREGDAAIALSDPEITGVAEKKYHLEEDTLAKFGKELLTMIRDFQQLPVEQFNRRIEQLQNQLNTYESKVLGPKQMQQSQNLRESVAVCEAKLEERGNEKRQKREKLVNNDTLDILKASVQQGMKKKVESTEEETYAKFVNQKRKRSAIQNETAQTVKETEEIVKQIERHNNSERGTLTTLMEISAMLEKAREGILNNEMDAEDAEKLLSAVSLAGASDKKANGSASGSRR